MTDGTGELNGPGNQQVYANVYRVGQDQGGNFSQYYAYIEYRGNGYGSWGVNGNWSMALPGWNPSGGFSIGYDQRFGNYGLWSGYFNVGHDGEGHMGGFGWSASINTDHDSVGDGSVSLSEGAAPRIPKRPTQPQSLSVSNIQPTQFQVNWTGPADWRGSTPNSYLVRVSKNNPADQGPYEDFWDPDGTFVVTNREPGQTYYVTVYAHGANTVDNGGFSNYKTAVMAVTPAGVYVSDGTNWIPVGLNVSDGVNWLNQRPAVSDGSAWINPA